MTKEKLEQAQAALDRLEDCQWLLESIRQSNIIAIGPSHEVTAKAAEVVTRHAVINHFLDSGMIIGLEGSFFDNPKIRELCCLFKQELAAIIEKEVESMQREFDKL